MCCFFSNSDTPPPGRPVATAAVITIIGVCVQQAFSGLDHKVTSASSFLMNSVYTKKKNFFLKRFPFLCDVK